MYGIKWENKITGFVSQGLCNYTKDEAQEFCNIYDTRYLDIKHEVISEGINNMLTETEIEEKFGLNPLEIGFMPSDYWLVTEPDAEDREVGAELGDLCISTLDGDNIDISAGLCINYIGSVSDPEDPIYRYYYFTPIDCFSNYNNNSTRCKECNVAVECYESANGV